MATAALSALVRQLRRRRPKGGQRSLRDISSELAARDHLNEGGCFLCGFDCLDASRAAASPHSRVKLLAILGISRPLSFATQPVRVPLKDFLFAPLVQRRRHVPVQAIEVGCARTSRTNCIRQIGPRRIRMLGGQIRALRPDRTRQCRCPRPVDIDCPLSDTAGFAKHRVYLKYGPNSLSLLSRFPSAHLRLGRPSSRRPLSCRAWRRPGHSTARPPTAGPDRHQQEPR